MKEERAFYQEHIVTDPRILQGKPVVKGTRIALDLVLEELSHNPDVNELLAAHPDLTLDDAQACLAYAKDILTGEVSSAVPKKVNRAKTKAKPVTEDDTLFRLIGIGHSGKGDVSANKHKYLADAYHPH